MLKDEKIIYGDSLLVPSHLNYGMYFLEKLKEHKNAIALINAATGEQITYEKLSQDIVNFANSLENLGIGRGDTVGVCSENRIEYVSSSVGVICTGAVVTLVNPSYSKDELIHTLKITKPKCLVISPNAFKSHCETLKQLDLIKHFVIFGEKAVKSALMFNDLIAEKIKVCDFTPADVQGQSDGALILYSSGTTGMPKGVLLTHLNLIIAGFQPGGTKNKQRTLTVSPWCNAMGYIVTLHTIIEGVLLLFLPRFEEIIYLNTIQKYKVESLTTVPPIVVVLAKSLHIHKYDVTSVKTMYCGAAPLDLEVINGTKKAFPNLTYILQGYGMSEATGAVTRESELAPKGPRPGSVGTVVPGLIIKVVDIEKRTVLGPYQSGEVCIKGPVIFKEYLGKSTGDDFDEQGYFKTGDVAYYDDDGYFYIVDRIKELIKYKGWQVPPAELEAILLQHPAVRDVGVVGAPDQLAGEVPTAFVVKQLAMDATEQELMDFVGSKINAATGEQITYEKLSQDIVNFANSLENLGIGRGDTVGVCSENRIEYVSSSVGVICTGAVVTLVNPSYSKDELIHTLKITKPKCLVISPNAFKSHCETLKQLDLIKHFVIFGEKAVKSALMFNDLIAEKIKVCDFTPADVQGQSDGALILYSSGTTGMPKGVLLTHLNLIIAGFQPGGTKNKQRTLTVSPWCNAMGYIVTLHTIIEGVLLLFLPRFEEIIYLNTIQKYKVESLTTVPPIVVVLAKSLHIHKYDVTSVKTMYCGAAPLDLEVINGTKKAFPNLTYILQGYGMSEATGAVTRESELAPKGPRPGSVGTVVPGLIIKVVDIEKRTVLGPYQSGEVCIKGPVIFKEYLGKSTGDDFDEQGYFKTGDVAYYDDDGYFYIVDRIKELIKYKGWQVPPAELEAILLQHPAVRDVGVVGAPDQLAGEVPTAFVVKQLAMDATEQELMDFVGSKINAATGEQITYEKLSQDIVNFANSLENLGIGRGDTVGVCSENRIEYVSSSVGVICTGAVVTLVNPSYSKDELIHTLKITKPKCLVISPNAFKSHCETLKQLDLIKHFVIFGEKAVKSALMFNDLIAEKIKVCDFTPADVQGQSDGALILYSSGTTGMPKGVLLTHLNLIIAGFQPGGTKNKQRTLTVSPWCNAMGYIVTLHTIIEGVLLLFLPRFEEIIYLNTIQKYKVESLTTVPPIVVVLAKSLHIHKYDVTSVKTMYCGAAPLDLEVINGTKKAFPNLTYILQGYGMSEATGAVTRESELAPKGPRPGSVGTVVPGLIIKVVDIEKRTVLGPYQSGEVCIKGPVIFKEYLGKSTGDDFDEQGYFKTGDVAYYDDDGYFYIVDRIKELIKYKGWQVPPAELEAILLQHPAVRDVGVVGAPDQLAGEVPTAFVVKQLAMDATEQELMDFVGSKINAATGEQITYEKLSQDIVNFANSLENLGIGRGDTVGVCSENRIEYVSSSVGVICTGAVVTLVNPSYSKDELIHTLKITKPKCLVISPNAFKSHCETLKQLDLIKHFVIFGEKAVKSALMFNDLIAEKIKVCDFTPADVQGQSDGALILYSSGTTGMPKGVLLTHLNLIIAGFQPGGTKNKQRTLTVSPWCNAMGYIVTLHTIIEGVLLLFLPRFEEIIYLNTIQKYKVESLTTVPPIVVVLAKSLHIHKYDVTSVKTMYCGAAPLDLEVINGTKKAFPNLTYILQGYGMSEATGAVTRESELAPKGPRPGSVGTVVPGLIIKVVDIEKRTVLGPYQSGEVCIKGPVIFKEYLGKSTGDDFDEQGYFKTGDVAYYDDDGYFYIVDRIKELIKYKGWQVPPAELEAILLQHPAVRDVGVVGAPDQLAGEVPTAFVVKQLAMDATEQELMDFVGSKVSPWKQLRGGVRFISEIPKTPSGKILRRRLREMLPTRSKL